MVGLPHSVLAFQRRVPDDAACAACLTQHLWSDGFACPGWGCDRYKAWQFVTEAWTCECAGCPGQTSVRAGSVMHASEPPPVWFWDAYLMATHSTGMSARQLGLGS